jgi:hypothetical protein
MGAMGARIAEGRHADVDARVTVRDNLEDSIVVCVWDVLLKDWRQQKSGWRGRAMGGGVMVDGWEVLIRKNDDAEVREDSPRFRSWHDDNCCSLAGAIVYNREAKGCYKFVSTMTRRGIAPEVDKDASWRTRCVGRACIVLACLPMGTSYDRPYTPHPTQ